MREYSISSISPTGRKVCRNKIVNSIDIGSRILNRNPPGKRGGRSGNLGESWWINDNEASRNSTRLSKYIFYKCVFFYSCEMNIKIRQDLGKKLDIYLHTNYSISASMSRFFSIKLTKWILIRVKHTEFGPPRPKVCDQLKAAPSLFPLWVPFVRIDKDLTNDGVTSKASISHLSSPVKFHT